MARAYSFRKKLATPTGEEEFVAEGCHSFDEAVQLVDIAWKRRLEDLPKEWHDQITKQINLKVNP